MNRSIAVRNRKRGRADLPVIPSHAHCAAKNVNILALALCRTRSCQIVQGCCRFRVPSSALRVHPVPLWQKTSFQTIPDHSGRGVPPTVFPFRTPHLEKLPNEPISDFTICLQTKDKMNKSLKPRPKTNPFLPAPTSGSPQIGEIFLESRPHLQHITWL